MFFKRIIFELLPFGAYPTNISDLKIMKNINNLLFDIEINNSKYSIMNIKMS